MIETKYLPSVYTAKRAFQILREDGFIRLIRKGGAFLKYRGPIGPVYRRYVRWKRTNLSKHDALPDPYKKLNVDPGKIRYMSGLEYDVSSLGQVVEGDWDQSTESFHDYDMYHAFEDRFVDGVSWSETEFYRRVVAQIESGEMKFGCETVEEFDQRCEKLEELYRSIKENGYLSGEERSGNDPLDNAKRANYLVPSLDEIKVDIGRNGEFLFVDGRHRLAMTKILQLESIPVIVLRRHVNWQRVRDAVSNHDGTARVPDQLSEYTDHPDLQDLQQ
ncbi:hypothetical protein [Halostagnicola bangensis]